MPVKKYEGRLYRTHQTNPVNPCDWDKEPRLLILFVTR